MLNEILRKASAPLTLRWKSFLTRCHAAGRLHPQGDAAQCFCRGKRLRPFCVLKLARMIAGCLPGAWKNWAARWNAAHVFAHS